MRHPERPILYTVIATGICSMVVQLVTIREYLTLFQGNEFVIALILFLWLLTGGAGVFAAHTMTGRLLHPTAKTLGYFSLLLIVLAVGQLMAVRILRDLVFTPGTATGFYATFYFIAVTATPYALLVGFLLPFGFFVLRATNPAYPATHIYITDNIGDVCGGALFSFGLIFFASPFQAIALANLPLYLMSWRLLGDRQRPQPLSLALMGIAAIVILAGIFFEIDSLKPSTGRLAFYQESRFGRISVVENSGENTLFKDGRPVFKSHNQAIAEEAVHYPLSQLPDQIGLKILLISIESGMLAQLDLYKPARVDYVELDPAVSQALFRFQMLKKIEGLNVVVQDGRRYLRQTNKIYDAILISMGKPDTFQVNRFFTTQFFDLAKRHLNPGGILSFSMQGFDNYLAEPQRQKLSVLFKTVKVHFKQIILLPGQRVYFLCRDQVIDTDIPTLLVAKGIDSKYVAGFFHGNVTRERITKLNALMDPSATPNSDFAPRLMRIMFNQWFARFDDTPSVFFIITALFLSLYLWRLPRDGFVLFSTGFTTMGSEILVIFAIQIFFGYIYFQIGLIVTVFLAGLLPGAWFGDRLKNKGGKILKMADAGLILLMGIFLGSILGIADRLPAIFFLGYGFTVALLGGFQFPLVVGLGGGDKPAVTRAFSADLIGAAAGALITSVILMPYVGVTGTILVLMGLKTISFAAISLNRT
jgi:spermidine synthase